MLAAYLIAALIVSATTYFVGSRRGAALAASGQRLHSLPAYHGMYAATAALIAMLALLVVWSVIAPRVTALALNPELSGWVLTVAGIVLGVAAALWAMRQLAPLFRARNRFESLVKMVLIACSAVAILTTVGIVFSVLFETLR